MSTCFNPRRRHLYPESVSARRLYPDPHCGFLLEGARIHEWCVATLLKSNEVEVSAKVARERHSQPVSPPSRTGGRLVPLEEQTSGTLRGDVQPARSFPAQTYQPARQAEPPSGVTSSCLLPGHTAPISALAWARNGRALVSGSEDGEIRLWTFQGTLGHQGLVHLLAIATRSLSIEILQITSK